MGKAPAPTTSIPENRPVWTPPAGDGASARLDLRAFAARFRVWLIAAGGVLVILTVWRLFAGGDDLPRTLGERTRLVGDGWRRHDPALLDKLSAGTWGARPAGEWLAKTRGKLGVREIDGSVETIVRFEDFKGDKACSIAIVHAHLPPSDATGDATKREAGQLLLFWKLDSRGCWRLDGPSVAAGRPMSPEG
jgi:hypothetical protein